MSYPRIIRKVTLEPWAILPSMHETICEILVSHIEGRGTLMDKTTMAAFDKPEPVQADGAPRPGPHGTLRQAGSSLYTRGSLAVIPIDGVLGIKLSMMERMCGGCSVEGLQSMVEEATNNPSITRVLFDVSSPGGMTYSIAETGQMIAALSAKKETFSVTEEMQGSAAQWLAAQARTCYATSSSIVGSIGVFTARLDASEKRKKDGTSLQIIKAGKYKAMGADAPLTEEERSLLQSIVDEQYAAFTSAIREGRKAFSGKEISSDTMQGQIFSGTQGVKVGLIDALVPSALSLVRRLA